jgi:putative LysE/RhtB family amino acid efflux pump
MHLLPLIKGILIGLLISVPTGAVGFLCVKRALTHHWKASIISALGSISADLIFGLIVIFGLTSISNFFLHEQNAIRLFGGLLLIYVGIKTFFDIPPAVIPGLEKYEHLGNFASTFTLTVTNPIQIITLPIVFASIGTGVTPGHYDQALFFLAGLAGGAVLCWIILVSFITSLKKHVKEHHFQLINRISGILIIGTGFFILISLALNYV